MKQTSEAPRQEFHIPLDDSGRDPVEILAERSGLSRQRIKTVMNKGAVWLTRGRKTRRLRRRKTLLQRGDGLHLYYDVRILDSEPPSPRLVADLGAYSLWEKPRGMLSQGSKWGDHSALGRWAEQHLEPRRESFIVHRLDRAARGLMLLAHDKATAAALSQLFRERRVEKHYRVWVHGQTAPGSTLNATLDGREAISRFRCLRHDADNDRSLLEVEIDTGRKHQIRRHLAGIGHPVVGDRLYGKGQDPEDLQLTAWGLAFVCPTSGKKQRWELALDKDRP